MARLTPQDRVMLEALSKYPDGTSSSVVAREARLTTSWPGETASRHLIKLSTLGCAEKLGTRAFPWWRITPAGRAALTEGEQK